MHVYSEGHCIVYDRMGGPRPRPRGPPRPRPRSPPRPRPRITGGAGTEKDKQLESTTPYSDDLKKTKVFFSWLRYSRRLKTSDMERFGIQKLKLCKICLFHFADTNFVFPKVILLIGASFFSLCAPNDTPIST